MQVSNVQDHCTHAVIGGHQTIEFGISSSAEFFNILSSTLYSNQILAVVREVICNAWDAHIAAGCTDKPIEITLDAATFRVRDFGKGIPHDSIGEIYGTYGNSTKTNDGKQTGGFGLGCKAPFAYTDHFEVTSTNAGIRTIYTMSKSSAQAVGKPGITPITSFHSADSGLQVSLGLKTPNDQRAFDEYIRYLAYMGDIRVSLNGQEIKTLGMQEDFAIVFFRHPPAKTLYADSQILIRYGNVTYPLPKHDSWAVVWKFIADTLRNQLHESYQLILQASPHSISVTPSRESLSLQEHTINTIRSLLTQFEEKLSSLSTLRDSKMKEFLDRAVKDGQWGYLQQEEPSWGWVRSYRATAITSKEELLETTVRLTYPQELRSQDLARRVEALAKAGIYDPGLSLSFIKALASNKEGMYRWAIQTVFSRIANGLSNHPSKLLTGTNLYTFCNSPTYWRKKEATNYKKWYERDSNQLKGFLKKIVIISHGVGVTLTRRIELCPDIGPDTQQFLVYHANRSNQAVEAAVDFFTKKGYKVFDFTKEQPWDTTKVETIRVKKAKTENWLPLRYCQDGNYGVDVMRPYSDRYRGEKSRTCTNPKFYVNVNEQSTFHGVIQGLRTTAANKLVRLFGEMGCVAKFKYELEPLIRAKVPEVKEWLIDYMLDYLKKNPQLIDMYPHCPAKVQTATAANSSMFSTILSQKELCVKFGITPPSLTDNQMEHYHLLLGMINSHIFNTEPEIKALGDKYASTRLAPEYGLLVKKLNNNHLVSCIDNYNISRILNNEKHPARKAAIELLVSTINS